jgi:Anti-sigma-K factor rskA
MSNTGPQDQPDEATVDLLVKQVAEGLPPSEKRALDALDSPEVSAILLDIERAAAAITLVAVASHSETPPPALQARLEHQGRVFLADNNVVGLNPAQTATSAGLRGQWRRGAAGWFAAAACLLLAVLGWLRSPQPAISPAMVSTHVTVPAIVPPTNTPTAPPTPAEERAALLARTDSLKLTLGATKDPAAAGVTGDVVWDPLTQRGFLHFIGLRPNDPRVQQYQAWIFDGERDKRYPVDAGVFDVPANSSEVIVPLHAALPVRVAKAFAVTIEKPGGVVVSALHHVVVLGAAT